MHLLTLLWGQVLHFTFESALTMSLQTGGVSPRLVVKSKMVMTLRWVLHRKLRWGTVVRLWCGVALLHKPCPPNC